jgi:hypothetical protein
MEEWRGKGERKNIFSLPSGKEERRSEEEMNGREGMECLQRYVPTS